MHNFYSNELTQSLNDGNVLEGPCVVQQELDNSSTLSRYGGPAKIINLTTIVW